MNRLQIYKGYLQFGEKIRRRRRRKRMRRVREKGQRNENKTCNNKKETKNGRVYRKQRGGFFWKKSFWKSIFG